jgi:hypothetical protein
MGANAAPAVVRMAHQRRRPIANGRVVQQVDDRAYSGVSGGNILGGCRHQR